MTSRQKVLIGGLGAFTPLLLNLLVVDFAVVFKHLTVSALVGYVVRALVLFGLGGLVAFLHTDETSRVKVFELGIFAPALITSVLNGGKSYIAKTAGAVSDARSTGSLVLGLYAQTPEKEKETPSSAKVKRGRASEKAKLAPEGEKSKPPQTTGKEVVAQPIHRENIRKFTVTQESTTQQFWRGLVGSTSTKVWFVIVGSHQNPQAAENQAEEIRHTGQGFDPQVYEPYGKNPNYAVVMGANLTLEEAQSLRERAIAAGLSTYLWTFPKSE